MNDAHRDFLVTYDPGYFEQHSESSEFEQSIPSIPPKNSNQFLITKEKITKKQKDSLNRKIYTNHDYKREPSNLAKTVQANTMLDRRKGTVEFKDTNGYANRNFDRGNPNKQKKSLIHHRVIPCLSNMFGKSVSKASPKENQPKNVCQDYGCQVQNGSGERRHRKKVEKEQNYTVQPVYIVDRGRDKKKQCGTTENTQALHDSKSLKRVCSNIVCNIAMAEKEREITKKLKRKKYKKRLQSELKEANIKLKYNSSTKHYCQQFPSKQSLYHVFASSNQGYYSVAKASPQRLDNPLESKLSITSSGFWDYLVEKFNKKPKSSRPNPFTQCQRKDCALQCCPVNFDASTYGNDMDTRHNRQAAKFYQAQDEECPCSDTNIGYPYCKDYGHRYQPPIFRKQVESKNTQCECYPPNRRQAPTQCSPAPVQPKDDLCGCQKPHDLMCEAVANKYNGEVLCIHNPPCILINGCLNVAPPTEPSVKAWPVIATKKDSPFREYKKGKNPKEKKERIPQYQTQCVDVTQCMSPVMKTDMKTEKIIQSICNHNPPCEVVRCCHKPKYDPKIHNSCVHVPMCPKVPECLMQRDKENKIAVCEHKPKCPEVPICTRKFVALTAKDTIGTQVKPQTKMICRHNPPCIMIPKCLGAVQETYISYEAIPNCVHQPLCDLIPACCRKPTKGMVPACCQYPNGCRVV